MTNLTQFETLLNTITDDQKSYTYPGLLTDQEIRRLSCIYEHEPIIAFDLVTQLTYIYF